MKLKEKILSRFRSNAKLRWLSMAGGAVLLVVVVLIAANMSASKANGAPTTDASAQADKAADDDAEKKEPVPVEVEEIATGTVSAYITASANLVAENQVKLLGEVEGRVATLLVEEGDFVRKGQPLATLVDDDAVIRLKKAQFKETNAQMAFERGEDLISKELISREEFDKFTMDYEIARQELAEAEWSLEKTTIRAPFSGQISERMIQVGKHVRPGDELFQVTDYDPLIARIFLPERDVLGLEEGRDVRITLNADSSVELKGRIRQISPIVDTATGTVKVTVEANAAAAKVRPGSFVSIAIVRETHADSLLLPREAVLRELQKAHVFVVKDDVAVKRPVTLGLEEGGVIEAMAGVEAGEQVIVAGQGGLKDGSAIKILGLEEPTAEAQTADATVG